MFPHAPKWLSLLLALVLSVVTTLTFAEGRQEVPPIVPTANPCAFVTLQPGAILVRAGDTETINAKVTSCSTQDESISIDFSFTPFADVTPGAGLTLADCGTPLGPETDALVLRPRDVKGLSVKRVTPACAGYYLATGTARAADGSTLWTATTIFHVYQP